MSSSLIRCFCSLLVLVWVLPGGASAQNEGEQEQQQLPEIAPREIEIRGELQLSFPSLERQPLRGFASPATFPSVREGRTPYVASYKQTLDNLPESLPAPESVSQSVATPSPPKQGLLEIGGGRYASRFARSRLSFPLTPRQTLAVQADYTGTEGFTPFAVADVDTPADDLEGRVRFESRHNGLTVRAEAHGSADQYTLYGVPSVTQNTAASAPDRSARSGGTTLQLRTHGAFDSAFRVSYDQTQYETQLDPTDATTTAVYREGRLGLDGSATFSAGGMEARIGVSGSRSTLGGDVPSDASYGVDGGGTLQLVNASWLSVRAGGRFLGFEAPAAPARAPSLTASASFVVPQGRVELTLDPAFMIYARNTPGLSGGSLGDVYAHNPYATHAPSVRPTLSTTDAEAGLRFSLGPVQLRTTMGYRYAPSYRYYFSPTRNGEFLVGYDSARILHGDAQVALQGITGVEASAGVSVRNGTLVGDNTAIPYFSPVVADVMLSISFADQRGLLQTTGTVESPRPVDRAETDDVSTYVSFDVEASFEVTSLLDVVARIDHVGPRAPKRWARYPRPPATVMGGFRIHW